MLFLKHKSNSFHSGIRFEALCVTFFWRFYEWMCFLAQILRNCRVFPKRLTNGGIFNNRLLFENSRPLFSLLFSGNFCGGEGLDGGDKVVMGDSPVPPLGKPWTEKLKFSLKGPRTVKL